MVACPRSGKSHQQRGDPGRRGQRGTLTGHATSPLLRLLLLAGHRKPHAPARRRWWHWGACPDRRLHLVLGISVWALEDALGWQGLPRAQAPPQPWPGNAASQACGWRRRSVRCTLHLLLLGRRPVSAHHLGEHLPPRNRRGADETQAWVTLLEWDGLPPWRRLHA